MSNHIQFNVKILTDKEVYRYVDKIKILLSDIKYYYPNVLEWFAIGKYKNIWKRCPEICYELWKKDEKNQIIKKFELELCYERGEGKIYIFDNGYLQS